MFRAHVHWEKCSNVLVAVEFCSLNSVPEWNTQRSRKTPWWGQGGKNWIQEGLAPGARLWGGVSLAKGLNSRAGHVHLTLHASGGSECRSKSKTDQGHFQSIQAPAFPSNDHGLQGAMAPWHPGGSVREAALRRGLSVGSVRGLDASFTLGFASRGCCCESRRYSSTCCEA